MPLEVATHPDDLLIICAEAKEYPGKFVTNFYYGEGQRYRPILTCDQVEALAESRESALGRIREFLESLSIAALYHGSAPKSCDEFIKCIREAGYTEEQTSNEKITGAYNQLTENSTNEILSAVIDVKLVLNANMINEIMERLATADSCDTSRDPLTSFPGPPTY